jgi:hypothetical protein
MRALRQPGTKDEETASRQAFFLGFVGVLLVTFTPFKALGYLMPFVLVAWLLVGAPGTVVRDRVLAFFAVAAAICVAYMAIEREFLVANFMLAVLTYSTLLPVIAIDSRAIASRALQRRMVLAASTMVLLQGVVGIIQAVHGAMQTGSFAGDNGDYVAGTIYPHLSPEKAFSNPMFAVNMSLMLLSCLSVPEAFTGRRRIYLYVGTVGLVLASVMHVLVFLVVAVVGAVVLTLARSSERGRSRVRRYLLGIVILVSGLSYIALPDSVSNIAGVAEKAIDLDAVDIPRAVLLGRVIMDLPDDVPAQPLVGLGPGQFSSRASLIASGLYLGGPDAPKSVPFLTPQSTSLASEYCFTVLMSYADKGDVVGSSQQPFFSFLSVYTELGALGVLAVFWWFFRFVRRVLKRARVHPESRTSVLLLCTGVIFLLLLGVQDNYWESPQAILVGVLLLKVMYANIMYGTPSATDPHADPT